MRLQFGSHTLDLATRELWCDGEPVRLEPRSYEVLAHLVHHRDRVVTKEELLDELWGDRFVGDSALSSQIKLVRSAVGDDGRAQRVVKTVHRVGYRFVADVVEQATGAPLDDGAPAESRASARATSEATVAPHWVRVAPEPVGREGDLAAVRARLDEHRLVTITGPGGVGKSLLAATLLRRGVDPAGSGPDHAWVCPLAEARDASQLGTAVLDALGQGQQVDADATESVLRVLESRRALLVLDGCEHLLHPAAALVGDLLVRCPGVRVVATSRAPLGIDGESVHPLEPLAPADAVACFLARAGEAGATVDPTDPDLVVLCERLDRIPLAIELAAARARLLSPSEMLDLLADRFRLLRSVADREPTADPARGRHESLRRTIAWSWEGLDPDDRDVLARLSVFAGGFTVEDVRAVVLPGADPLDAVDALGRLVGRSVVSAAPAAPETRFRLLDSVRDFAAEHLVDAASVHRAHAEHFAALAESLDEACQGPGVDEAVTAIGEAWPNLRVAVRSAAELGDRGLARRTVRAVGAYADVFQAYEVLDWCEHAGLDDVLVAPPSSEPDRRVVADALAVQARMLAHRGDQDEARRRAEAAHELAETHATVLSVVWCAYYRGDLDLVVRSAERLLQLSRSDRGFDRGFAEGFAAIVTAVRQEVDLRSTPVTPDHARNGLLGVQDCFTEGLRLCTADPGRAAALLEAVVDEAVRHEYRLHLGAAASTLTQITLPGRPPAEAMRVLRRTLQRYLDRSMWVLISADTVMAAKLLADHGEQATACRLLGAREASGYSVGLSEVLRASLQAELADRLGDRFDELAGQGSSWRPPEAGQAAVEALDRVLAGST